MALSVTKKLLRAAWCLSDFVVHFKVETLPVQQYKDETMNEAVL